MKKLVYCFVLLFFFVQTVSSQIVDPFAIRYQINHKGGLVFLANSSIGCNCAGNTEMPPNGSSDNNDFSMSFVDIDSDASTFMSSSDQLALPNCSEVVWAGLYWEGILNDVPANTANYTQRNLVKLSVNGGAYTTLTADELLDNNTGKITYFAFKDITSIVTANPTDATYRVANVVTQTGLNTFGGWTMVVVYRNIYESMKNITVFDGLANVSLGGTGTVTIDLSGFLTPPSGAVNFELGVVAHDGDRGQTGDQLQFDGTGTFVNISDALHPSDNVFNSTISRNGVLTPLRNPSYNNNLGHDANIYSPDNSAFNYIGNSATSASIKVISSSETILTSVITSAIDIYEPDLRASVSYTDLNAGTVQPGDILEYSITAKNIGSDVSVNTFLTDTLDSRLTYIPGSMQITYGPNMGNKTDATDADQAEFLSGDNVIRARIGTGANGVNGGTVVNSSTGADSTVIKFRVQLTDDCGAWMCGSFLENKAYLFGTGQISGISNGNGGLSDLLDQNGCPSPESGLVVVDPSSCPLPVITYTDSLCVGETATLSFPSYPSLTISWTGPNNFSSNSPNISIPNIQLNQAGNYVVHITYNGEYCIDDTMAPIVVTPNPTIQLLELVDDSCYHSGAGLIRVDGNGNAPFTYLWSNNDADSVAQNLMAGNYSVTVTDQYGCSASNTYTVDEPAIFEVIASITSDYNGQDISCPNAEDGSATAVANGGSIPYTYDWLTTGVNTPNISNLDDGQYIIEVTDNSGCKTRDTINLVAPADFSITGNVTNVLCFGETTGALDVTVSGGTSPYDFSWSNSATTEDLSNIGAGPYTLNVTDANGCSSSQFFNVFQPNTPISMSFSTTPILCNGDATGSIDINVSGGTSPYDYSWSNSAITQDLQNITAGSYTVVISDNFNCTLTHTIILTEPTAITATFNLVNPVCQSDSQGNIDMTLSGGTPAYSIQWNNGETSEDIVGLYAGVYSCEITDQNGCVKTFQNTLTDPDAVSIAETHVDVLCFGNATGSIDITPSNGTIPYAFDWSNSAISEDIVNLNAGLYSVNVTDANNCGGFMSFVIDEPDTLIYLSSTTVLDVNCFGGNNGSIDIEVAGGIPSYDYLWSNNDQTQDLQNLTAGTYDLSITDQNGCQFMTSITVDEPAAIDLSESHQDVLCFGDATGSIDITVQGGSTPYTYQWSNSAVTEDISNLAIGTYSLTVTDDNLCQSAISVTISQPANAITILVASAPVLCFGGSDGSIDLTLSGGTPQYFVSWDNGQGGEDLGNLAAGTYSATVTDLNGCISTASVEITEPQGPIVLEAFGNGICLGATDGMVSVQASGGTPGYTYLWNTGPNDTLSSLGNLTVGIYTVTVTDYNGCTEIISANVEQPEGLPGCVTLDMPNIFTPNSDNNNNFFIPVKAINIADYHIIILNRWGNLIYEGDGYVQGWDGLVDGKEASEGVYFWKVDYTDAYGEKGQQHGNLTLVRK